MKAYLIDAGDEETGAQIYFGETSGKAKAKAAAEEGISIIELASCRRAPEFDEFAATGVVPAKALIEAGWWFECYGCGRRCDEEMLDDDDDEGEPLDGPIYRGNRGVWCSTKCQTDHDWRREQEKAADDADITACLAKFPGSTKHRAFVRGDHKRGVSFEFGGQDGADWIIGESIVHISQRSVTAWEAFREANKR